jgi:hypothetical protein
VTTFVRPAPDLAKIIEAWSLWKAGGDALPGRTMADMKIGGIDKVFETVATDADQVANSLAIWKQWESGKVGPNETLAGLAEAGFDDVIAALASVV